MLWQIHLHLSGKGRDLNWQDWKNLEPSGPFKVLKIGTISNFDAFDEMKTTRVDFWNDTINPNEKGAEFSGEEIVDFYDSIAEKRLSQNRLKTFNFLDGFYAFARKFRCCCCCVTK